MGLVCTTHPTTNDRITLSFYVSDCDDTNFVSLPITIEFSNWPVFSFILATGHVVSVNMQSHCPKRVLARRYDPQGYVAYASAKLELSLKLEGG